MTEQYSRLFSFENIVNFRDLGGYQGRGGRNIAWRRLFRSGGLLRMSFQDKTRLKEALGLKTVIDLRSPEDADKTREIKLLEEIGVNYFNIPFRPDDPEYYKKELEFYRTLSGMGEVYMRRVSYESFGKKLVRALEIIAGLQYYPLLFHCGVGKDRTGMLTAILLKTLDVSDTDIINDYVLSDATMDKIRERILGEPQTSEDIRNLPDFTWRAAPDTMFEFLFLFKKEYGSAAGYLKIMGADNTLVNRLEKALLV